ncbi:hypothetical protein [Streptomyces sp. NPDC048425]|uniref:hypothetical protein n=1 Tax=Streptomyces sp. NPDC048425 TaxID=3365548 RepID=UPI00371C66F4
MTGHEITSGTGGNGDDDTRSASPGGRLQERPVGWAGNPLAEFDELLNSMSGLLDRRWAARHS